MKEDTRADALHGEINIRWEGTHGEMDIQWEGHTEGWTLQWEVTHGEMTIQWERIQEGWTVQWKIPKEGWNVQWEGTRGGISVHWEGILLECVIIVHPWPCDTCVNQAYTVYILSSACLIVRLSSIIINPSIN